MQRLLCGWGLIALLISAIFGFEPLLEWLGKCRHEEHLSCQKCLGTEIKVFPLTEEEIAYHKKRLGIKE